MLVRELVVPGLLGTREGMCPGDGDGGFFWCSKDGIGVVGEFRGRSGRACMIGSDYGLCTCVIWRNICCLDGDGSVRECAIGEMASVFFVKQLVVNLIVPIVFMLKSFFLLKKKKKRRSAIATRNIIFGC